MFFFHTKLFALSYAIRGTQIKNGLSEGLITFGYLPSLGILKVQLSN
jgi:hypothetical protein